MTAGKERPADWLQVESLDIDAQGVARRPDGKVVFIDGALPGEWVSANVHRKKNSWEQATLMAVHEESAQRVRPRCPHFGLHEGACGGCRMQHLHIGAQVAIKQRVLEDNLWHLGKVKPESLLRPIEGPPGVTAGAPAFRCAMCARRARCWSASTSARAAMWPISANATWCRRR
jgi:23S rRNA (uracil1939-C5)-methyltransferase